MRMIPRFTTVLSLWSLVFLVPLAGCPTGPATPTNQPPTANAGADQSVASGATVVLTGTGADPDGGAVTFAWTQTAGTTVTLTNPNSATAEFTAPATSGVLTFRLTVTDSQAASTTADVNVTVTATMPTVTPRLFIANFVGSNVTSYANPATINGNIAPDTNLAGANTELNNPSDIIVDAAGALSVSNFNAATHSITSYDNAVATNGNLVPNRNLQGAQTQLTSPTSLAIDAANDLLFVSNNGASPSINIYASASTATGNLAPTRVITTTGTLTTPFGINLDNRGNLYVANNPTTILVYANAGNLNGNVAPTRTIVGNPAFTGLFDVFVDISDRMYVVNSVGGRIDIFNNASTLNGTVAPDFTLTIPSAGTITAIAVDALGRGYIAEEVPVPGKIYSYDGIATLNGTVTPTRTIAGTNTLLNGPIRLFLQE